MLKVSIAPDGKEYPLPSEEDAQKEREILIEAIPILTKFIDLK